MVTELIDYVLSNRILLGISKGIVIGLFIILYASLLVLFLTWLERKVAARIHVRYGPNRTGPFGLLQPLADGAKLIQKEDIIPYAADRLIFTLAPVFAFAFAVLPFAAMPFAEGLILANLNVALLYIIALASLSIIPVIMAGWASNNKYSLLGAMRAAALNLSYEIPLVLSIMSVVLVVGSLNVFDIVNYQSSYIFGIIPKWIILLQPLGFFVFFVASIAEMSRIPFDMPESESELIAGFHTEYSGMKFAMLLFAEYIHMILGSMLAVLLFLGGWHLPGLGYILGFLENHLSGFAYTLVKWAVQFSVLVAKALVIMFVLMWIRMTLPRARLHSIPTFYWKYLLPLALINLGITAVAVALLR